MSGVDALVVGAAPDSLGEHVVDVLAENGYHTRTAGIGVEDYTLDITSGAKCDQVLLQVNPKHVICTVGINEAFSPLDRYGHYFAVNCTGVIRLLESHCLSAMREGRSGHFVAISSNSARIPRTDSAAYCASKAALSMALRVRAREMAGDPVVVYGYEPGLLAGTPMTREAEKRFTGPLHRMKGVAPVGLEPRMLAEQIVRNLSGQGLALNGCLLPYDAGEQ